MTAQAYPLHWPEGWPRTKSPGSSQFKTSLPGAIKNVQDALRKFADDSGKKMESVMVSSNVSLMDSKPADAAVAVYFTWDGLSTCIAVDRYAKVEDNLQAIYHCIEAKRTMLRHGGINIVRAAFRGYAALPPPTTGKRAWHEVLGVDKSAARDVVAFAHKNLRKSTHPDAPKGNAEKFLEVEQAWKDYEADQ